MIRALAFLALSLTASPAAAQWSTNEWRTRCAASSGQVVMEIAPDLTGRSFECRYFLPDGAGDREILVVSDLSRRAIEEALTDVSEWYDGHGFREPLIHDIYQPVLSSTPEGASASKLPAPIRLGPLEEGTQFAPFLALIDPLPVSGSNDHGGEEVVMGYYYSFERTLVVSLNALRGPDGQALSLVPDIDRDTIAHEMFHAILAAVAPIRRPQFINEGLSEMFGRLYVAERFPQVATHPLATRVDRWRFSEWPLNSGGPEAYDSAVFWRHLHDRVVDGASAFVRLVNDYDLTVAAEGSGAADAWLRAEAGIPLMTAWTGFAQRISAEAEAAGTLDDLVRCQDIEPEQVDPVEDTVFHHVIPASQSSTYQLTCLRVTLPRADAEREVFIEDMAAAPFPAALEIFADGENLRGRRLILPVGQTTLTLILAAVDPGLSHEPVEIEVPELRLVLEAPRSGCDPALIVRPLDLTAQDRARMQALSGRWRVRHHNLTATNPRPACTVYSEDIFAPRPADIALRYEAGALTTNWLGSFMVAPLREWELSDEQAYDFFLVRGAGTLSDIPGFETECGTAITLNGRRRLSTDWLREVPGAPTVFLIERREAIPGRNRCEGVAIITDHRMVTFSGFTMPAPFDDVWWESLAYERPRRR